MQSTRTRSHRRAGELETARFRQSGAPTDGPSEPSGPIVGGLGLFGLRRTARRGDIRGNRAHRKQSTTRHRFFCSFATPQSEMIDSRRSPSKSPYGLRSQLRKTCCRAEGARDVGKHRKRQGSARKRRSATDPSRTRQVDVRIQRSAVILLEMRSNIRSYLQVCHELAQPHHKGIGVVGEAGRRRASHLARLGGSAEICKL